MPSAPNQKEETDRRDGLAVGRRCRYSGRAVLIVVFAFWLPLLPVGGVGSRAHLVLPAVTLALPSIAMIARMTRSSG